MWQSGLSWARKDYLRWRSERWHLMLLRHLLTCYSYFKWQIIPWRDRQAQNSLLMRMEADGHPKRALWLISWLILSKPLRRLIARSRSQILSLNLRWTSLKYYRLKSAWKKLHSQTSHTQEPICLSWTRCKWIIFLKFQSARSFSSQLVEAAIMYQDSS